MIAFARWLDDQCSRLTHVKYRIWFGFGVGAILMAIAWLAPVDRILEGSSTAEVTAGTAAQPIATGASGLPLPRFVSVKSQRANVRIGPTRQHDIAWTFTRSGLPVEIVAEFENWRRIRDSGGNEGWIFHALLSGDRKVQYDPWQASQPGTLRRRPDASAEIAAHVENRAVLSVVSCDGEWCRVSARGTEGHVRQERLWGVYPGETIK